ncbi:hypothetical protein [Streptomyces umbrinus]|uniref:hypothetical protein n=1 Tax=Streptomyces umbrinus TaxID=67370 RepID=UPI003C2E6E7E
MKPFRALRQIVAPAGKHRPRRVQETVTLNVLMRPEESLVNDEAWCPAEQRFTYHAYLRMGGRVCWTCRWKTESDTLNPTATPGGAE